MPASTSQYNLKNLLEAWHERGLLRAIDINLANLLVRHKVSESIAVLAALVSFQAGRGHTCLSLQQLFDNPLKTLGYEGEQQDFLIQFQQICPNLLVILNEIENCDAIQLLNKLEITDQLEPLCWDQGKMLLYLRRYWQYEQRIANWLNERIQLSKDQLPAEKLLSVISQLVENKKQTISWQRVACANAARQMFSVITGGPGTGKTYTVVRVLATLLAFKSNSRIALAAPTGKAAARMDESVNHALAQTDNQYLLNLKSALNRKATTLHRLLGVQKDSRYFKHNKELPLPYDVVVVDEASMIDTEMFDALLDAIGPQTRLILLGDKDQLAPVEAGSILASICKNAQNHQYSNEHRDWLMKASGEIFSEQPNRAAGWLDDHIVMLEGSERFKGAIADLALSVNSSCVEKANEALKAVNLIECCAETVDASELESIESKAFWGQIADGFKKFFEICNQSTDLADQDALDAWASKVLSEYANYQLLTALRTGPWGQLNINQMIEKIYRQNSGVWYHGKPVMVTSNDYNLNLNNGDIGIALKHPIDQKLRVVFAAPKSTSNKYGVRWVLPSRLVSVETVYAMTVHKSQGSEFSHAVMILPDLPSPVLTKELIYTGITRAKSTLTLVIPNRIVWTLGIKAKIERLGGLG